MDAFAKAFPERFFQTGIAEANMIGMAAGFALSGKIPYAGSFANFCTTRVLDQIRMLVAYSETNVKICGSHAGITTGEDGATHQVMEDIGFMKTIPTWLLSILAILIKPKPLPWHHRLQRTCLPSFRTSENAQLYTRKSSIRNRKNFADAKGTDVTIFATGHLVYPSLEAAYMLYQKGVSAEVINIHTIKPLDIKAILHSVQKTKCVVTAEEHLINSGLGDSIAQVLVRNFPCPQEYVAMDDRFGLSGKPEEL